MPINSCTVSFSTSKKQSKDESSNVVRLHALPNRDVAPRMNVNIREDDAEDDDDVFADIERIKKQRFVEPKADVAPASQHAHAAGRVSQSAPAPVQDTVPEIPRQVKDELVVKDTEHSALPMFKEGEEGVDDDEVKRLDRDWYCADESGAVDDSHSLYVHAGGDEDARGVWSKKETQAKKRVSAIHRQRVADREKWETKQLMSSGAVRQLGSAAADLYEEDLNRVHVIVHNRVVSLGLPYVLTNSLNFWKAN